MFGLVCYLRCLVLFDLLFGFISMICFVWVVWLCEFVCLCGVGLIGYCYLFEVCSFVFGLLVICFLWTYGLLFVAITCCGVADFVCWCFI